MTNPFERFYDTKIEVYSQSGGSYSEGDTRLYLGSVICDIQPMSDKTQSELYGLSDDRYLKLYCDKTGLIKNGNLIRFGGEYYRIVKTEEWSFGMTASVRSLDNAG